MRVAWYLRKSTHDMSGDVVTDQYRLATPNGTYFYSHVHFLSPLTILVAALTAPGEAQVFWGHE